MAYQHYYAKRNKYGAKRAEYNGRKYHSKFEAQVAQELDLRMKAGELKSVKPQHKIDLRAYDQHICNYYIDFKVVHADDTVEYIEVKGFATETWRIKWKLFEAQLKATEPDAKATVYYKNKY